MLNPDLYPSNIRISDIKETLDDYYMALYTDLNDPQKPPEMPQDICKSSVLGL
jgi:hypothetical protein